MSLIGIDIGGTLIRVGAVSNAGELLHRASTQTLSHRGPGLVMEVVVDLIREVCKHHTPTTATPLTIGIGITGPVDIATGIVSNPHTLQGWPPTDILAPLKKSFPGASMAVDNDANTAALGEWWVGAGRGTSRLATVTVGTGIGVGFLIEGEIQRGSRGRHGEAGHQVLDPKGPRCYCGARGCWEVLASGTALSRRLNGQPLMPTDSQHLKIVHETARWIGLGMVNLCAIFAPDTIVIGGGVGAHFALMQDVILDVLQQHRAMIPTDVAVRAAQAGDDAGLIGAALLARHHRSIA